MTASTIAVRRQRELDQRTTASALTPTATVLIAVGAASLAAWLWSWKTQPGVDAATLARLQPRRLVRPVA